ncbi:response regulator transcription factor [Polynucleobacter sp. MWH-CaK5]|uniref:response regulator transcription factor n=1 Tax=Polynucleobacter sp. MWH-CaK5 TaxID=2689107 RepID=UPI001BFE55A1|nr:response regulator transcription factor [Polynucleobacter sp. MWH-CaK5]QWD88171.1 response regulator transcription factor [Polynucleobacter sp. MWH-CaK5]
MSSKINIAVVEDHDVLREMLLDALLEKGYLAQGFRDAYELDAASSKTIFELLILDLNLPGEDGLSIAKRIKESYPDTFIIMITARSSEMDKIQGYEAGADIYLPKPIAITELQAAVSSLSKRILRYKDLGGNLILNEKNATLKGSQTVSLSKIDLDILLALLQADQQRLDFESLLNQVSSNTSNTPKATLEVQIVRLRKKMAEAGAEGVTIKALYKYGYQLVQGIDLV